ncbi:MAG: class I SAM-dependent methyltransferase [Bacteroidia bacterium]|nr:class I SAM-dependent methyltransferase [Bacteroidia bacterium]
MINKITPSYVKNKIYSLVILKIYQIWHEYFIKQRYENEKYIPKYELQQKHIQNLKVLLNRESLLTFLPKNAICTEIGVNIGDFSEMILKQTTPQKLHLIDAWGDPSRYHDGLKDFVRDRFEKEIQNKIVELNIGYSTTILKEFPNHYFDWVYLDTNHSYTVTADELAILKDKVKPDGIIAGHDFIMYNSLGDCRYGVIEAVHELCVNYDWELIFTTANFIESPSFAIKKISTLIFNESIR